MTGQFQTPEQAREFFKELCEALKYQLNENCPSPDATINISVPEAMALLSCFQRFLNGEEFEKIVGVKVDHRPRVASKQKQIHEQDVAEEVYEELQKGRAQSQEFLVQHAIDKVASRRKVSKGTIKNIWYQQGAEKMVGLRLGLAARSEENASPRTTPLSDHPVQFYNERCEQCGQLAGSHKICATCVKKAWDEEHSIS